MAAATRNTRCPGRPDLREFARPGEDPCGNTIYEREGGFGDVPPTWRCSNCGHETPRRARGARKAATAETPSQLRAIEAIRRAYAEKGDRYDTEITTSLSEYGSVMVDGKATYRGARNSLNDSRFFAIVGRGGKVEGQIFPSLGSTEKFTGGELYKLGIY